jgi:hypothetical protein
MPEIPELGQSQVDGEENAGPQQEKNKPLVPAQVAIQEQKKFIDFLHNARKSSNYLKREKCMEKGLSSHEV